MRVTRTTTSETRRSRAAALTIAWLVGLAGPAGAETIDGALARAYLGNPTLDAQRANVRATDENVPRALSGYRPSVVATANAGALNTSGSITSGGANQRFNETLFPRSVGIQATQNLFNGFRTD
ncbi:MAG: TolC family protein, partial [Methylobacteriaceae bacterium]|nr:TolC family protein [Methylobacteriaceae bacterium]